MKFASVLLASLIVASVAHADSAAIVRSLTDGLGNTIQLSATVGPQVEDLDIYRNLATIDISYTDASGYFRGVAQLTAFVRLNIRTDVHGNEYPEWSSV